MILPGIATPKLTFFSSLRKTTLAYGFKTHQHCIFFLIFECCVVWYQFVISLFSMSTLLQMIYDDIWSKSFHFKEKEVFCVLSDNHYHAMPGSDFSKWNNIIKKSALHWKWSKPSHFIKFDNWHEGAHIIHSRQKSEGKMWFSEATMFAF